MVRTLKTSCLHSQQFGYTLHLLISYYVQSIEINYSDVRQGHYHKAAKILTMEIRLLFKSLKTKKDVTSVPREVYPNGLKGL